MSITQFTNMLEKRATRVTVEWIDSTARSEYVDSASGGFERPFPREELLDKFASMLSAWEPAQVEYMMETALGLPETNDFGEWLALAQIDPCTVKGG